MKSVFFSFCYEFITRYINPRLSTVILYGQTYTDIGATRRMFAIFYCVRAHREDSKILQVSSRFFEYEIISCASVGSGVTSHAA
jgi:hypothetical protein